jgi:fructan beta-fructosidase
MKNKMKVILLSLLLAANSFSALASDIYKEQFRPEFHFSPKRQWMNDPNGLVYLNGEYHLFFQNNPYSTIWGPMHWGHAVSKDLVHWEQLPIALYPDNNGSIFSGNAVYDSNNTSGLGTKANPPLVAIFTQHNHFKEADGESFFQYQSLAYSTDKGRSWQKYSGNPILKSQSTNDFRDPKMFWHEASQHWVMTLAVKNKVSFYSSSNLKVWTHESDFGETLGSHGGVWECPDLVPLPKISPKDKQRYALLVSINPGGPNGGSATQYFIGDFDGSKFQLDKKFAKQLKQNEKAGYGKSLWLDYGRDNYAGVTWSNQPANRPNPIIVGWMNNWDYANEIPLKNWRGAMTLARELKLVEEEKTFHLLNYPVADYQSLVTSKKNVKDIQVKGDVKLKEPGNSGALAQHINLSISGNKPLKVTMGNTKEKVVLELDATRNHASFNRDKSGLMDFSGKFAGLQRAPYTSQGESVSLDIYLDKSSIEIFVDGGRLVFTNQIFPTSPYTDLTITSEAAIVNEATFEHYASALKM